MSFCAASSRPIPTRNRHSHAIHIGDGAEHVLVEECEDYTSTTTGSRFGARPRSRSGATTSDARSERCAELASDHPNVATWEFSPKRRKARSSKTTSSPCGTWACCSRSIRRARERDDALALDRLHPPSPGEAPTSRQRDTRQRRRPRSAKPLQEPAHAPGTQCLYHQAPDRATNDVAVGGTVGVDGRRDRHACERLRIDRRRGRNHVRTHAARSSAPSPTSAVSASLADGFVTHGLLFDRRIVVELRSLVLFFGGLGALPSSTTWMSVSPVRVLSCSVPAPSMSLCEPASSRCDRAGRHWTERVDRDEDGSSTNRPIAGCEERSVSLCVEVCRPHDYSATSCTGSAPSPTRGCDSERPIP